MRSEDERAYGRKDIDEPKADNCCQFEECVCLCELDVSKNACTHIVARIIYLTFTDHSEQKLCQICVCFCFFFWFSSPVASLKMSIIGHIC